MSTPIYIDASHLDNRIIFWETDTHEDIRNKFVWEQRQDSKGKPLATPKLLLLKEISNKHLKTLCYFTLKGWHPFVNKVMIDEWNYRIDNKIIVGE